MPHFLGVICKSRFLVLAFPITSSTFKTGGGHGSMKREGSKGLSVKDSQSSHFGIIEIMGILSWKLEFWSTCLDGA